MEVLAIVPARGGSKGIVKKNLAPCAGKPLIEWTYDAVKESKLVTQTIVSSDDPAILANVALDLTAQWRPAELATDEATTESVIEHVLSKVAADIIVLLQPTSPVRTGKQIDEAVQMLVDGGYDSVLSVAPSHAFLWANGNALNYPYLNRQRRQDMPSQYEENGSIYVFTRQHWDWLHNRLGGKIGLYVMPEEGRFQIDTPFDLWLCEQILLRREADANG